MPKSLPLNQFFVYLRDQAAVASRNGFGSGPAPDQGGGGALDLALKAFFAGLI